MLLHLLENECSGTFGYFSPAFPPANFEGNWHPSYRVYLTQAAAKNGDLVRTLSVSIQVLVK